MSMDLPRQREIADVAINPGQKPEILEPADRAPAVVGLHLSLFLRLLGRAHTSRRAGEKSLSALQGGEEGAHAAGVGR
jgi:hypothetical protein